MYVEQIKVRGLVQGVGFRPFVWHLARDLGLCGWVFNDITGVTIQLYGPKAQVEIFAERLCREAPPLAEISAVQRIVQEITEVTEASEQVQDFRILASPLANPSASSTASPLSAQSKISIPPDISICSACADEVLTPGMRRYRYPFTNCTYCGPRLSIIRKLPYDRERTVMVAFPMCEDCAAEYGEPADRRYHAQPIACPNCGPRAWLCDASGCELHSHHDDDASADVCSEAAQLLRSGKILAIKGLGGFQFACDASSANAVAELRRRKRRPHKPFALMLPDLASVAHYCELSEAAAKALQSPSGPIVLLPLKNTAITSDIASDIAPNIAPKLNEIGVMLPTTPLHLLLLHDLQGLCGMPIPLVMTSGNLSGEPQCTDNGEAIERLREIADYWLLHNREIVCRVDDSVLRSQISQTAQAPKTKLAPEDKQAKPGQAALQMLRWARGYAPRGLALPEFSPSDIAMPGLRREQQILGFGAQEKGAFAFTHGDQIVLSQYFGDLSEPGNWRDFQQNLAHYRQLYGIRPHILACDSHPEYISAKYARSSAAKNKLQLEEVQHHHAHIAACMAEHGLSGSVLGVTFDGLGYGQDATQSEAQDGTQGKTRGKQANVLWGGEFFSADYRSARRLASLRPLRLHTRAASEPWRCLLAHLLSVLPPDELEPYSTCLPQLHDLAALQKAQALHPYSSSVGRLFDAVAALLLPGMYSSEQLSLSYESQAPMQLEAMAQRYFQEHPNFWQEPIYRFGLRSGGPDPESLFLFDPRPMWRSLLAEYRPECKSADPALRERSAFRFHLSLAHAVRQMLLKLSEQLELKHGPPVLLTGGVFQNTLLLTLCRQLLEAEGFRVYSPQRYPANDGAIALGQVVVAAARAAQQGS